jgi:hypothetical protein
MVFRSFGAHSNRDNIGWATFVEQAGQLVTTFTDVGSKEPWPSTAPNQGAMMAPPIEPNTTYYYRMFIVSLNYEVVGSNVVFAHTLPLRAMLSESAPLTPLSAYAGDVITLAGLRFATGMTITIGGVPCPVTIASPTSATVVMPTFLNPLAVGVAYDVVLTSSTGLTDVYAQGVTYLGTR